MTPSKCFSREIAERLLLTGSLLAHRGVKRRELAQIAHDYDYSKKSKKRLLQSCFAQNVTRRVSREESERLG